MVEDYKAGISALRNNNVLTGPERWAACKRYSLLAATDKSKESNFGVHALASRAAEESSVMLAFLLIVPLLGVYVVSVSLNPALGDFGAVGVTFAGLVVGICVASLFRLRFVRRHYRSDN